MPYTANQYRAETLRSFCCEVLERLGVLPEDARMTADVLIEADLRGVDSHGIVRLNRYVTGIRQGIIKPRPRPYSLRETPCTVTIDADAGLGQPASCKAMNVAILKARKHGLGSVAVRNSNHFGIAGYYAMMALAEDMIGICTTNSEVLVVPTLARNAFLGTNPIAVAVPSGKERPFVLDMSTSTVTRGKLEVYMRQSKSIPLNWAIDENGLPTSDPTRVLKNIVSRGGGGLLPLGGASEECGGHKGYGLAMVVEIFSSLLSGALYADRVYPTSEEGKPLASGIGHFFAAISIDVFRPREEFKRDMDDLIRRLHNAPKAIGASRIFVHGEKEFEKTMQRETRGISLDKKVVEELALIADQLQTSNPFRT